MRIEPFVQLLLWRQDRRCDDKHPDGTKVLPELSRAGGDPVLLNLPDLHQVPAVAGPVVPLYQIGRFVSRYEMLRGPPE